MSLGHGGFWKDNSIGVIIWRAHFVLHVWLWAWVARFFVVVGIESVEAVFYAETFGVVHWFIFRFFLVLVEISAVEITFILWGIWQSIRLQSQIIHFIGSLLYPLFYKTHTILRWTSKMFRLLLLRKRRWYTFCRLLRKLKCFISFPTTHQERNSPFIILHKWCCFWWLRNFETSS